MLLVCGNYRQAGRFGLHAAGFVPLPAAAALVGLPYPDGQRAYAVEPGRFEIMAGASPEVIRLRQMPEID